MVKTEAQNLAISIYEQIKPALSDIADAALEFIQNFDFSKAVTAVQTFLGVLGSAGVAIAAFKTALVVRDGYRIFTAGKNRCYGSRGAQSSNKNWYCITGCL